MQYFDSNQGWTNIDISYSVQKRILEYTMDPVYGAIIKTGLAFTLDLIRRMPKR